VKVFDSNAISNPVGMRDRWAIALHKRYPSCVT
jgi:hypothetical protein